MTHKQFALLLLLGALWGASFMFTRVAAPVLGAVWLVEARVLLAALVLLPLVWYQRQFPLLLKHRFPLSIAGLFNSALPFVLLSYAAIDLTAGLTSILNATVPIFSVLFAWLVVREALLPTQLVGVVLGFFGVIILVGWSEVSGESPPALAIIAGLLAAISYVYAAHFTKRKLTTLPPMVFVVGSQFSAALLILPLMLIFLPYQAPDFIVIGNVLGLALLSTALAFIIYFRLLNEVGPTRTLTVAYWIPVFAVLWSAIFLKEAITFSMVLGGALILAGTALTNWKK